MKISKKFIFISLMLLIISLILITQISRESILYDILNTMITGCFISLMLEIPYYEKIKNENYRILFNSLLSLKTHLLILSSRIEKYLSNFNYISDDFYESCMSMIFNDIAELQKFDLNYYTRNKENSLLIITNIINRKNVLSYYTSAYSISFNNLQINLTDQYVKANLLIKELRAISRYCKKYSKTIDKVVPLLLNKKQYKEWIIKCKEIRINPF